jgi:hypothetical protein
MIAGQSVGREEFTVNADTVLCDVAYRETTGRFIEVSRKSFPLRPLSFFAIRAALDATAGGL